MWSGGETRSSLSVSDLEAGSLTEFYEHGAEVPSSEWAALMHAVKETLPGARWLTISGSVPLGAPEDGYLDMVAEGRRAGARTALDASGKALARALRAGPDLVKVNAAEAADLLGVARDALAALEAARSIRDLAGGEGHGCSSRAARRVSSRSARTGRLGKGGSMSGGDTRSARETPTSPGS